MKKILSILFVLLMLGMMADAVTYTTITGTTTAGTYTAAPASWVTLQGNGSIDNLLWPDGYDVLIGVNVTGSKTTNFISIIAGDNPPAFRSAIGNLTYTTPGLGVKWFGPLESARFKNTTGYLRVGSKNLTGTVSFIKVPA